MRRRLCHFGPSMWVIACLAVSHFENVQAQNNNCSKDTSVGELVSVENSVEIVSSINSQKRIFTKTASANASIENRYICEGDEIIVGPNSRASLFMTQPKSVLRLDENTIFQVKSTNAPDYGRTPNQTIKPASTSLIGTIDFCRESINRTWLNLKQGALHIFTTQPQQLNINTPYMNASVEGTEFVVRVDSNQAEVSVIDGVVGVCNTQGNEVLTKGQRAAAQENAAPERVEPVNAVQWALYYPILGTNESTTPKALEAYELANKGQSAQAVKTLNNTTNDDYSLALRSTIAVANNQLEDAQTIANQALVLNEESPSAWMAKSYVQQANFDLPQALSSVEKANGLNPNDAIILARLAELRLSNDDKKGAQDAAELAEAANPVISRTQTVLGFMQLSQFDIDDAKESFNSAIDLDEADPLPRLGLGLANIRKNDIEEGKKNIEIAVSLDPGNSLLRSYLGKTYFENNDDDQASEQLALAVGFDSNDPTPSLYSAFVNQSNNRPTQALMDLQKSIEKNDNRAVYRSRLALDEDLATRSASAARIYDELGFDQLTILEGAKSLAQDPGNYSAHRLMADAYLNRPRHEIARVSELLQSQIRQPLNNNPAQVQLSDSRLGAFRDSGPFNVSFNEFSRLYTKEGFSGKVGLLVGDNNTQGEEVQVSNLLSNTSFTLTGYNFETDNGRENSDEDNQLVDLFVQHQLTDNSNIQLEYRNIDVFEEDDTFRFNREDFNPNLQRNIDTTNYRFGLHHKIDENNEILINLNKERLRDERENVEFFSAEEFLDRIADVDSELYELQYVHDQESLDVILGINHTNQDRIDRSFMENREFRMFEAEIEHTNTYLYLYPSILDDDLSFTLGVSYDDLDDPDFQTDRINPKFGAIWNIDKDRTIRIAAFDTIKRTLAADQTLEPTNISGFNQFYDDFDATETSVFGIGFDQALGLSNKGQARNKLLEESMFGIEWIKRDIKVPGFIFDNQVDDFILKKGDLSEDTYKAYLYLPYKKFAFTSSIEREEFDRELFFELDEGILDLKTWRFGLGLKYFIDDNWYLSTDVNYVNQNGNLFDRLFFEEFQAEDKFWVADLEVGYRIKKSNSLSKFDGLLKLKINNLFESNFNYQDTVPFNPRFSYEREVFFQAEFSF